MPMRSSPGGTRSSAKSQGVDGGGVGTDGLRLSWGWAAQRRAMTVSTWPATASWPWAGDVRPDLVGTLRTVGLGEPLEEASLAQGVLLRADRLDDVGGEHRAEL